MSRPLYRPLKRVQTPLETLARDMNFRRGRIIRLERHALQVLGETAPKSTTLAAVVRGVTRALLRHHDIDKSLRRAELLAGAAGHNPAS